MKSYYYPKSIRKITVAFLSIFSGLIVQREQKDGTIKEIQVPVKYGPTDKAYQYKKQLLSGQQYYQSVPSITVALTGQQFDTERATGLNETRLFYDKSLGLKDLDAFWSDTQPSPWNFTFQVNILTESMDDYSQILENILPYFRPATYIRIKEFDFLNIERDLQVVLDSSTNDFLMEQDEETRRYINGTLDFTVKGFVYSKISNANVIHEIQVRFGNDIEETVKLPQVDGINTFEIEKTVGENPTLLLG